MGDADHHLQIHFVLQIIMAEHMRDRSGVRINRPLGLVGRFQINELHAHHAECVIKPASMAFLDYDLALHASKIRKLCHLGPVVTQNDDIRSDTQRI